VIARRLRLGSDLEVLEASAEGLEVQGRVRLRPGQTVELVSPASGTEAVRSGRASVVTWQVARLGTEGTTYRGHCRWQ
jgi:hypothetical protein